jgi:phosphate-selective porin OprO and OprP
MKTFTKIALAISLAFSIPAYADEYIDTLNILRDKGILTQKEYDAKIKAYEDKAENKKFSEQRIDKDVSESVKYRQARANDGSVTENGIGLKSKDGNNTIQLTGRLHMDYRQYSPDYGVGQTTDSYQNLAEMRRARFGVRGQFAKDFKYELVGNFGNDVGAASSSTTMDVAWVNYAANPELQYQFGLFKMPFSLEQLQSSNNIDMMERSLIGQVEGEFIPGKETGFMLHGIPKPGLTYALAVSRGRGNKDAVSDGLDYIGRVTTNIADLTGSKTYIAHLGAAYSTGDIKGGVTPASARTESRSQNAWFTGPALSGITTRTRQGLEAAFAYNALKVQAEQFNFKYDPTTGSDQEIKGYYVLAVYNLTGESYNYKDGVFGAVKPNSPLDKGGRGAWQIGVRMSEFDASNISVATGKSNRATAMTYGLTWFATDNLRFMVNYVDTKFDSLVGSSGSRVNGDRAIMFRSQLNF